jgi:hypothetical protein
MARAAVPAAVLAALLAAGCAPFYSAGTGTAEGPATRGTVGPLSFDYPAAWALTPVGHPKHYETVLAFLTSPAASARESCGPDYVPGMGAGCTDTYVLPPGGVVIRLSQYDGPAPGKGAAGLVAMDVAAGWQARTVAGDPAAYDPAYADASTPSEGTTVAWFVAGPGAGNTVGYAIVATVNGSDPGAHAAVDAILASLRISPTVP